MTLVDEWMAFAKSLRGLGLSILAIKGIGDGEGDLKFIGLPLLCRTLSNHKAAITLVESGQIVEARTIARCCFENHFWMHALAKHGEKFKQDMLAHEMAHKRRAAQTLFDNQVELDDEREQRLREWLKKTKSASKVQSLDPKGVAQSVNDQSYMFYQSLSSDAHPTVSAMDRYYAPDRQNAELVVEPSFSDADVIETLHLLCLPVLGVYFGIRELLKFPETPRMTEAAKQYLNLMDRSQELLDKAATS